MEHNVERALVLGAGIPWTAIALAGAVVAACSSDTTGDNSQMIAAAGASVGGQSADQSAGMPAGMGDVSGAAGATAGSADVMAGIGGAMAGIGGEAGVMGGVNGGAAGVMGGAAGQAGAMPDAGEPDAGGMGSIEPPFMCPATSTLTPGESNQTISVGGTTRSYILRVPARYQADTPMPLVIDWHPLFGTGSGQRGGSGYRELSESEGFIVAWPSGIDNAWNIGPCCTRSRTVDDVGLARAIVDAIKSRGCVDPKRVYATGFSMGGGMSHFLACNAADVFAAVVPAAFDLLEPQEMPCTPARPIAVLSFRATNDFVVPYAGGASNPPNGLNVTIHFEGAVGTRDRWAQLNGCTDTPSPLSPPRAGCESYKACMGGVEVGLCTASNGHSQGDATLGWSFMQRHPMP